jgi:transmembrane sensor
MKAAENEILVIIIANYLSGSANNEDVSFLKKWVSESYENKMYFNQIRNIWGTVDSQNMLKVIDTQKSLEKVLLRISPVSLHKKLWESIGKIAAILLIPLFVGNIIWSLYNSRKNISLDAPVFSETYAAFGTRTALKLSDGSQVWLNSGSSLKYPDKFTGGKREVLLNGEAYFEVAGNHSLPFIVKTSDLTIKATGTKFNVMGYNSDSKSEITLVAGKVSVCELDNKGISTLLRELDPNQHLVYNKSTKLVSVNNEDSYQFYSWKDGKLIFRNEPLSDVVNKLSQVFNVDIELQGNTLQDYRYRATFEDESLSEILKLLKISSPISFKEIKRFPLPDGSFPKKRVIIFPVKTELATHSR